MSASGYFIFLRIQTGTSKCWYEDDPSALASRKLDADLDGCSVYHVNNEKEEAQVAAAHFATFNRSDIERIHGIKIEEPMIISSGLSFQNTPGTTGFSFIDQKHYDITGTKANFEKLAEAIATRLKNGENLVRYFEQPLIAAILRDFLKNNLAEMHARYKDKVYKCLKQTAP